jgi:hypothetical protein
VDFAGRDADHADLTGRDADHADLTGRDADHADLTGRHADRADQRVTLVTWPGQKGGRPRRRRGWEADARRIRPLSRVRAKRPDPARVCLTSAWLCQAAGRPSAKSARSASRFNSPASSNCRPAPLCMAAHPRNPRDLRLISTASARSASRFDGLREIRVSFRRPPRDPRLVLTASRTADQLTCPPAAQLRNESQGADDNCPVFSPHRI